MKSLLDYLPEGIVLEFGMGVFVTRVSKESGNMGIVSVRTGMIHFTDRPEDKEHVMYKHSLWRIKF